MDPGRSADRWLVQRHVPPISVVSPGRAALGFAGVALATTGLRSNGTDWLFLGLAVLAAAVLVVAAYALPRKGLGVSVLSSLYRRAFGPLITVGLGSAKNSAALLHRVTWPFIAEPAAARPGETIDGYPCRCTGRISA